MTFFRPSRSLHRFFRHTDPLYQSVLGIRPSSLFDEVFHHRPSWAPFASFYDHVDEAQRRGGRYQRQRQSLSEVEESQVADANSNTVKSESTGTGVDTNNKALENSRARSHHRGNRHSLIHPRHRHHTGLWDPFNFANTSLFAPFAASPMTEMTLDMYSTPQSYFFEAALPGIAKENINIRVDDGMLHIEAERRVEHRSHPCARTNNAETNNDSTKTGGTTVEAANASTESSSVNATAAEAPAAKAKAESTATNSAIQSQSNINNEVSDDVEYHYIESSYGHVERSLSLPEDVDVDKLSAKYENGVLRIELPRVQQQAKNQRTVQIQ